MKNTDSKSILRQMLSAFPRWQVLLASFLLMACATTALLLPSPEVAAKRTQLPLTVSLTPSLIDEEINETEIVGQTASLAWKNITVKQGDSLSNIFKRAKLSAQQLYQLTHSTTEAKALTRIFPGQTLHFQIDKDDQLKALRFTKSRLQSTLFEQQADGKYIVEHITIAPEIRLKFRRASIDNSLFLAGQEAGLPHSVIMEMANVFGGVIDFIYDPRKGDTFNVLYEEHYLDGEKIGNGAVLATQYINQGEQYTAFRYEYENGDIGYYTPDGISMRKAFLRAPLDFTRVSSGFNLRRKHPIHKSVRAHRGVDYAAPRGTPIFSAGDGRVVKAGYNRANGNYVFIQHGQQYITRYLHLNKRHVKRGQKVKQRQIIGTVGSTGYATGPHLHYEFLVNGVHRNPRTILKKLPKAKSIAKVEKQRFATQIRGLQLQLASYTRATQLAMLDTGTIIQ